MPLMNSPGSDTTLALAGVFQAATLVQQLARSGCAEEMVLAVSVNSVLKIEAEDTAAIFGGTSGLMEGLRAVRNKLGNKVVAKDLEVARYVMGLLQLQSKLRQSPWRVQALAEGIQQTNEMVASASDQSQDEDASVYASLAELYAKTVSTLTPRIIVQGEEGHLSNTEVVHKVRACLLAGVRAGFLWHQLGGRRWHLLLQRNAYVREADSLLAGMTI